MDFFTGLITYSAYRLTPQNSRTATRTVLILILIFLLSSVLIDVAINVAGNNYISYREAQGRSNLPTIQEGDIKLMNIAAKHRIKRGDFVTFNGGFLWKKEEFHKRVVAFEGEAVEIKGSKIYINGKELTEFEFSNIKYSTDSNSYYATPGHPYIVPPQSIFVLGDNSKESIDSRFLAAIKKDQIQSVTYKIIWPLNRIRRL